jgi:DNA (cytosine-5)-methyltransferase 1
MRLRSRSSAVVGGRSNNMRDRHNLSKSKPTAIDLFCGAGGLSEGLRQAGFNVLGAVDQDPLACSAYRLNHREVELWQIDIRRLSGSKIMQTLSMRPGELSLLAACPPCQGFSTMRTKNGTRRNRDGRNELILEVLRVVRSMKPASVMIENVPGLAKTRRYRYFRRALEVAGYFVKCDVLNTVDFKVPQSRRRLVLLASKLGEPNFAPKAKVSRTVRDVIGNLAPPRFSRDPLHNYSVERSHRIKRLIMKIPSNGGSRSALGSRNQLRCHKRLAKSLPGFHDVYGRMAWDKPPPTITGGCINPSKGRFLHPQSNRSITLREAALIQTFPKSYRFPLDRGRYPVAMLIGNALPPEFIRRHATILRRMLATG